MTALLALGSRLARVPLAVSLALLVVLRLAAGLVLDPGDVDLYEFGVIARNWVNGDGYSYFSLTPTGVVEGYVPGATYVPGAFMPPAYVVVVAGATLLARALALGPEGVVWIVRVVNTLLAAVGLLGLAVLVRTLAGPAAARVACLVLAVLPTFVYLATQVSAANLYLPLETWLLAGLAVLAGGATWRRLLAVAAGLGLLCLLRSEAVVLIPLVAVWAAVFARPLVADRRSRLAVAAAVVVVAAVLPAAWAVRNSAVLGEPVVTTATTGGYNLWIGNHPGASGSQKDAAPPPDIEARLAALPVTRAYEADRDAVFREAALDHIAGDPVGTVLFDARKLLAQVTVDLSDPRSTNPVYLGSYLVVAVLGVWGWVRWWRRSADPEARARVWLVAGYVVTSLAVPAVFFALARYRLPLELILVVGAALLLTSRRPEATIAPRPVESAAP
ncbi:hypothetical protein GCM10023200_01500 [Actinomycetospora chlora]|uniref:Dolichyl-phosphate-mannose-protein mannosyltransferase n=1 Tax=Actinomycetospora chlora TaxID=663608 RepID=A0ABP9A2M9_9PSEU